MKLTNMENRQQQTIEKISHCSDWLQHLRYLVNGDVVARLLKTGRVVVLVPHNDPHLMQDDRPDQLIGALDLHYDGSDVVWGLRGREKKKKKRGTNWTH